MHILIIEDDTRIAKLIATGLQGNDFVTTIAYDGFQAKLLINQNIYDLVVTDIILPHINGIDLCKNIKKMYPNIPVIMLTALSSINNKIEGFDSGADDYIVKPFEIRELNARIRALLKRNRNCNITYGNVLTYDEISLYLDSKKVKRGNIEIILTPKELKLLEYMLNNPERIISRNELSEKVWNIVYNTGTNFIDVYINYLRKKIDKNFDKKLIHTRAGLGFILTSKL